MRYIIVSNLILALLYLCFALLLRRETFHRFNRIAILAIMLLSLLCPLCPTGMLAPLQRQHPIQEMSMAMSAVMPEEHPATLTADEVQVTPIRRRGFPFVPIYVAGMLLSLCYTCVQILVLWRGLRHARRVALPYGNMLVLTPEAVAPFSCFRYIVMSEYDYTCNPVPILAHEQAHITLHHSYDLLLLQVFQAVLWFNPFAYLLGHDLRILHEYEADEAVIRQGIDAKRYVQFLVVKALGNRLQPFANHLRRGSIKQRIIMMYKRKSSSWAMLKALPALPVVALVTLLFVHPSGQDAVKAVQPSVAHDSVRAQVPRRNVDDVVFTNVEQLPVYKTGPDALFSFLAKNMRYPSIAVDCGVYGKTYVKFIVRKDGTADSFEVVKKSYQSGEVRDDAEGAGAKAVTVTGYTKKPNGESYLTRTEYEAAVKALEDEALRVCSMLQGWTPAKQHGRAVDCYFTLPIVFRLN